MRTFRIKGELETGERTFEKISPEVVNIDLRKSRGRYPEVWLRICNDNSRVRMLDAVTGKVLWAPTPGDTKYVTHAKLPYYGKAWRVFNEDSRDERERC